MENPRHSVWADHPLTTGIAALVCYAGVFNDVIGVEEMASRLGVAGRGDFPEALNELQRRGKIVVRDGFAALPNLADQIPEKIAKIEKTRQLIASRRPGLESLRRNPILKFVGISGSLAANNPVKDRNNEVDLDIFLITRAQCLWPFALWQSFRNLFPRKRPAIRLCLNYVMDESSLLIANRNFYTATELRNLIPVSGLETYRRFLQANRWAEYYYPGMAGEMAPFEPAPTGAWVNKSLYVLFIVLRSVKRWTLAPIREISFKGNVRRGTNVHVLRAEYGGYQPLVQKKFGRLAETWFPELLDRDLVQKLFPDELSAEIRSGNSHLSAPLLEIMRERHRKYG
ncbi:MAG TPA: hypothetical protein VHD32_06745 [Candidatus Didemnitutus sp.]|nr:hypothetical protein [Candidatus Didemnitutus sp.]